MSEWGRIEAVVVDAPESVTAGQDIDVVLELRNPLQDTVEVGPCPVWTGGFGGEDDFIALAGELPCDEIEQLAPGERIRLRLGVVAPRTVALNEGGELAASEWRLVGDYFRDVVASIAIPMQEPR